MAPRLLLIAGTRSYNAEAFVEAARAEGAEVLLASDRCHVLDGEYRFPEDSLVVDFYALAASADTIVEAARTRPVDGVVPAGGEAAAVLAAMVAERLGLRANAPAAAQAARDKRRMRELLAAAGVAQPRFALVAPGEDGVAAAAAVGFPCVVKPLLLSGSRGVMRADDAADLQTKLARLRRLLARPELRELGDGAELVLVESFVPGAEVAVEGVLTDGRLRVLALFDKPDPLDGPFFEETLYVTPSRHAPALQAAVEACTAAAAAAMGLRDGPVHAELRLAPGGPQVIEVAARSIGGLCGRMLRFGTGRSLEQVLVRHALGRPIDDLARERRAAGAMMIPIAAAGVLRAVRGEAAALAVPGIDELTLTKHPGEQLVPLPEGDSYLGFLFAHSDHAADVESALRAAHRQLTFDVTPLL